MFPTRTVCLAAACFFTAGISGFAAIGKLPGNDAELEAPVGDQAAALELLQGELERVAGPAVRSLEKSSDGSRFLRELFSSYQLFGDFMLSGPLPSDLGKSLRALFEIWKEDRDGLRDVRDRSTAVATALVFGRSGWEPENAFARYRFYRDSRKQGKLHASFEELRPWEKRFVTGAAHNGAWAGPGGWNDDSLVWLRDHVKLPAKDYEGACWQAPYHLNNMFGDSIHGADYYTPFSGMTHAERVRLVGGVCGSLSHFGANSANANGIPAFTMGEPAHCAYAVRPERGKWIASYTLSWKRGLHLPPELAASWSHLILLEDSLADEDAWRKSAVHRFQALALEKSNPTLAEAAYRASLEACPLNFTAWMSAAEFFAAHSGNDPERWEGFQSGVLKSLAKYPECAWSVISTIQDKAFATMDQERKLGFILAFHRAISPYAGPSMWEFEKALEAQAAAFSPDVTAQLGLFEKIAAIHMASPAWLAPSIAWAQEKFSGDPALVKQYFAALGRAFADGSGAGASDGFRNAIRAAILGAEKSGDMEAFQAIGKAGAKFTGAKPLDDLPPFSGKLLSSGGFVTISSTSTWDQPESHWGLLEPQGGAFHTDADVRPWVIVRLGKMGDLSGIVLHDSTGDGYNGRRQVPIKVSVSENGTEWKEVFRSEKQAKSWRIPLDGKATRVQYVKCERDNETKDHFHLQAIHAYGRPLQ